MKAIGIAEAGDLDSLPDYEAVADQLLVDARAPQGASRPGGLGVAFDWRLLAGRRMLKPWMLAGGLTPANVAEAARGMGLTHRQRLWQGVQREPVQPLMLLRLHQRWLTGEAFGEIDRRHPVLRCARMDLVGDA